MRVAINCRSILLTQRTGIGRYTYHLLDNLGKVDRINDYTLHAPKRLFDLKRRLPDFSRYKNFRAYIDQGRWGVSSCDVYHMPSPDRLSGYSGRLVVTVHDLVHLTYPHSHTTQTIALTEEYMQEVVGRADKIICISENTRNDLHRFYDIPLDKTTVVYNGVDNTVFYPLARPQRMEAQEQLKQLGIEKPFILSVGTIEPRKNLAGLLESFSLLKSKRAFEGDLVVVGMEGWKQEHIKTLVKQLDIQNSVIFTGFVSDEQLRNLYNLAEIFVFPSFYEGFGFPIVEAFCCAAPVVTSQTSSCGEIAGDAALLIDPKDRRAIAQAMEKIVTDAALKESLRRRGLERAKNFSFLTTARQTLSVYRQMAG